VHYDGSVDDTKGMISLVVVAVCWNERRTKELLTDIVIVQYDSLVDNT